MLEFRLTQNTSYSSLYLSAYFGKTLGVNGKIVTIGWELLQFIYNATPNFSINEQILVTFVVNKCFINFVIKSSNLASSTPPFANKNRPQGLFFYCSSIMSANLSRHYALFTDFTSLGEFCICCCCHCCLWVILCNIFLQSATW